MKKNIYLEKNIDGSTVTNKNKNMIKYTCLFGFTGLVCTVALSLSHIAPIFLQDVSLTTLKQDSFTENTYATGKIQEVQQSQIQYNIPIVADEVFVNMGDSVKVGDKIATIDFNKTKQAILNIISMTNLLEDDAMSMLYSLNLSEIDDEMISKIIPSEIHADYDGVISCLNVQKGNIVNPTESLAVISNLEFLEAILTVPENYADSISLENPVTLKLSAISGKEYDGFVSQISPVAYDTLVGTSKETVVNVHVDISNEDEDLKSGYSVGGDIKTSDERKILTLPYEAINQDEDNNEYVYVYVDGKAQKRIIETEQELENCVEVISGVSESDLIISQNSLITHDNQYVNVK